MRKKISIVVMVVMMLNIGNVFADGLKPTVLYRNDMIMRAINTTTLSSQLNRLSSSSVAVDYTLESRDADKSNLKIEVQQYRNGRWFTIVSDKISRNSGSSIGTKVFSVSSGYTYRTKVTGTVYNNGSVLEVLTIYTNSVDL